MSNLNQAIAIAAQAHIDQFDKAGRPYILHPIRLMNAMNTDDEKIVAILHDVVEDTSITLENLLNEGFNFSIVDAIEHLTKRKGEDYTDFINRLHANKLATTVKIADIKDNLNITRLNVLTDKDLKRIKKYHDALQFLQLPRTA